MSHMSIAEQARTLKLEEFISRKFVAAALGEVDNQSLAQKCGHLKGWCKKIIRSQSEPGTVGNLQTAFSTILLGDFLALAEKSSFYKNGPTGATSAKMWFEMLQKFNIPFKRDTDSLTEKAKSLLEKLNTDYD